MPVTTAVGCGAFSAPTARQTLQASKAAHEMEARPISEGSLSLGEGILSSKWVNKIIWSCRCLKVYID